MPLNLPVVWHPDTRGHDAGGGVWVGVRIAEDEVADRVDRILDAVVEGGARTIEALPLDRSAVTIHSPEFVDFMATAWKRWTTSGYLDDPGMDRVVAYAWRHSEMRPDPGVPHSVSAWTGMFATDTMTLIGPGTWPAVAAAASTAITAADLVVADAPVAYALARPPGHHAGRSFFGGSCYFNNAALAADRLTTRFDRVAIVDVDAHHGNGTQAIFWDRPDVRYGSVHVDPAHGWYPHYVGHADETGGAVGANLNIPLAPGTGDGSWLEAVDRLADFAADTDALVVSLGVDASEGDPQSPLEISVEGYREAGQRLGALHLPTVIVQEGGYVLDTIGTLVVAFLEGFEGVET